MELLEDNIGENLENPGYIGKFLDTTQKVWFKAASMSQFFMKVDFLKYACI